jgi:hypothetical protein
MGKSERQAFTRSRPYKKNDNAHVEQKNWSHVRQLFGYDRFEVWIQSVDAKQAAKRVSP